MSKPPTVSVVLTCYNLGQYLDEAVDSVLAQTFQDFEIIVVNDGSTDPDTITLLGDYRRPKTRVIHIENRGLSGARNEGIRQCRGAYICVFDADDRLEATYMEKSVAVLDHDPSVAFVSHWRRTFGDEAWDWKPESPTFPDLLDRNSIDAAALLRREALAAVGLFDESMRHGCEDWDVWIGLVERGFVGVILPEILFFYRRRPDSMSRMMVQGDTHEQIYGYLIEKHRPSFQTHLVELLLRRESEKITVLREAHDLALDCDTVFSPDVNRARDGLRVIRDKHRCRQASHAAVTDLARRAEIIAERDATLADRDATLADRDATLAERDATLAERDATLAERGQMLDALDGELSVRRRVIAEKDAELADQRQVIAAQAADLDRFAQVLADREGNLERLQQAAAAVQTELAREREGSADVKREIRILRNSLSWRLTRPLRAVYSWLFERE